MKRFFAAVLVLLAINAGLAQNTVDPRQYGATITQADLKELLTIIAADALEGRETGTRGQKMAAAFIAAEFKRLGLQPVVPTPAGPSYRQKFSLENYAADGIYLQANNTRFTLKDNILFSGKQAMGQPQQKEVLLVHHDNLNQASATSFADKAAIILAPGTNMPAHRALAKAAYDKGAAMVAIVPFATNEAFTKYRRSEGRNYARRRYAFTQKAAEGLANGYFLVAPAVAEAILGAEQETISRLMAADKPARMVKKINNENHTLRYFTSLPTEQIDTENVLGYLEGSDKKDELVIITAHYDHIGRNGEQINNGADDDGSGTVAVLEIAEAFARAKAAGHGPRRSILFMTVTGEEKGLIGSRYYTNNPVLPLANTVVDLNIDMIGRHDKAHNDNLEFVYLVGSDRLSGELHELSEKANSTFTRLTLDYTYNDENHPERIYYRSDHWNFARNNIPIIFYFSGVHEDYHRPTDTVDKIEFDLLQKRAQLIFYTAWVIANRDHRPVVDKLQQPPAINSK